MNKEAGEFVLLALLTRCPLASFFLFYELPLKHHLSWGGFQSDLIQLKSFIQVSHQEIPPRINQNDSQAHTEPVASLVANLIAIVSVLLMWSLK